MSSSLSNSVAEIALPEVPRERLPRHIAIIMDGNGRWARQRGLPRIEGHRKGVATVRAVVAHCVRLGIEQLTLYCLSSENWKRPPAELDFLMHLLEQYMVEERGEILRQNIRLTTIGRREGIASDALRAMDHTVELSRGNTGLRLCLAINYGGRQEIVEAVRRIAAEAVSGGIRLEDIDEKLVSARLDTADMPDPDLVVRTAGELRVSNFLLWQISYAEIWVTERCWPDFNEQLLNEAIQAFARRERRFGGLNA